jgi:hypothetical protein
VRDGRPVDAPAGKQQRALGGRNPRAVDEPRSCQNPLTALERENSTGI